MAVLHALCVFSLLWQALQAAAPGDEDGECGVPEYPAGIEVLLDSWRYLSLLDGPSPVWETSDRGPGNSDIVKNAGIAVEPIPLATPLWAHCMQL